MGKRQLLGVLVDHVLSFARKAGRLPCTTWRQVRLPPGGLPLGSPFLRPQTRPKHAARHASGRLSRACCASHPSTPSVWRVLAPAHAQSCVAMRQKLYIESCDGGLGSLSPLSSMSPSGASLPQCTATKQPSGPCEGLWTRVGRGFPMAARQPVVISPSRALRVSPWHGSKATTSASGSVATADPAALPMFSGKRTQEKTLHTEYNNNKVDNNNIYNI